MTSKIISLRNIIKIRNCLVKHAATINFILIALSIFYLSTLFLLDKVDVVLNISSQYCKKYEIKGDVLDLSKFNLYRYDASINNSEFINVKFPLRSKVFLLSLCPNENLEIKNAYFSIGNKNIDLFKAVNNCYYCDIKVKDNAYFIKGNTENSLFEVADYVRLLPFPYRILHYYLRYFPYMIFVSFLIFYLLLFQTIKIIIIKVLIISSLILIPILLYFNKIRMSMPPPRINLREGIGLSQYNGVSILADNLLYYVLILTPYLVYLIMIISEKKKTKKK